MQTVEAPQAATWRGHGQLHIVSAEQMRDLGFHVGPARRCAKLPAGVRRAPGWRPGRVLREPTLDEMVAEGAYVEETRDGGLNVLCNAGINRMELLLINSGGTQAYDATHTAIGVGDGGGSVPTAAATDTDLAAAVNAANRYFQMADGTYPSQTTQVVTIQSTFATGNANFEWREWGVDQHTASGATASVAPLLNHKGVDLGLKTNAAAWAFKITATFA